MQAVNALVATAQWLIRHLTDLVNSLVFDALIADSRVQRSFACSQENRMKDIENLFNKAVGEIERMLSTKTVVGEPITVEGNTLIPLVSVGFGFGVGAGEGTDPKKGMGNGGGTGAGGGVKPVALVIINKDGVRVETVKGAAASLVDKVADVAGKFATAKSSSG